MLLLATLLFPAGCHDYAITCDPLVSIHPPDTTIAVGESYRVSVQLYDCGGNPVRTVAFWRSQDTVIAAADSASGVVTGRSPGRTEIEGNATGTIVYLDVQVR